jgi:hypothetical protein
VRPAAQVDELALPVKAHFLACGDARDDLRLVVLARRLEERHRVVAIPHLAPDRLVALHDVAHARLDAHEVVGRKGFRAGKIVEEPVLDGRADGDLGFREQLLDGLGQHVGGIVAQQIEPVDGVAGDDLDGRILLDRQVDILQPAVDLDRQRGLGQGLRDRRRDVEAGNRPLELSHGAVRQPDVDHVCAPVGKKSVILPNRRA